MIVFPDPPQRIWVRSFWLALGVFLGGLLAVILAVALTPWAALAGLAVAPGVWTLGRSDAGLATSVYRSWNLQARRASKVAAAWLTRLIFMVVTVAGVAGSRFLLQKPGGAASGWVPKGTLAPEAFASQADFPGVSVSGRGWAGAVLGWSGRIGQLWVWPLIPVMALLGMVTTRQQGSLGGNIYTLY